MTCKTRYLPPAFWRGYRFVTQIIDHANGDRSLTCWTTGSQTDPCAGWQHVKYIALRKIPRGWRVDQNPERPLLHSGGSISIPLARRR